MVAFFKQHNCKDELQAVSLKATPARIAVMKFLEVTERPVDTQTIINYLKKEKIDADPATIFRMMNDFLQKGITKQIQFQEGKARYELSNKRHHHHLICTNCGKIEEVEGDFLKQMEEEIYRDKKFRVKDHALEFFGLCADCQE
ncbi:MAG: transcriptional repressor [Candidatus Levyibacteriota bacterium]|jgi:Fur family ferric uptake transcriptional regulator